MTSSAIPLQVPRPVAKRAARTMPNSAVIATGFLVGHVFLVLAIRAVPLVGLAHALGVFVAGVVYAATTKTLRNVSAVVAYIAGCEVLWRMTKVSPLWEFGKYACFTVLLVGLTRVRWRRNRTLAILYFALLLPAAALTLLTLPVGYAREEISFTLAGPLLLSAAVLFFSNVPMTVAQLRPAMLALVGPVVGIAVLCYVATTRARVEFVNASNDAVSLGFGANQVSAVLGLGTMLVMLIAFERKLALRIRVLLLALAIALGAQTALTFSRGGIVLALAGLVVAMFFLLRGSARTRMLTVVVSMALALFSRFVVQPRLDEFTGGRLSTRFSDTRSSGRAVLIDSEIAMFKESPVFGMGAGMGGTYRASNDYRIGASHTEYTRMIGEHGLFGILAIVCLVLLGVRAVRAAADLHARAIACAFVVWTGLFLGVNGTRVAAPAIIFGLAFALRSSPPPPVPRRA